MSGRQLGVAPRMDTPNIAGFKKNGLHARIEITDLDSTINMIEMTYMTMIY